MRQCDPDMTQTLPDEVTFAGARLPVVMTSEGVQIGAVEADYDGLAWVICSIAKGHFPAVVEQLQRGEDAKQDALYARRPRPRDELTEARERWVRLGGADPGDDVYLVGTTFLPENILIPRAALLLLIDELRRIRQQFPAAPSVTPPVEQAGVVVEDQLRPYDDARLLQLEEMAQELETLAKQPGRGEEAGRVRRELHRELDRARLLDDAATAAARRARVAELGLSRLLGYHDAAVTLLSYLRSDERKRFFPEPVLQVLGAPVSLDWFRLGVPTPARYRPFDWLAFWESVFVANRTDSPVGEILSHRGTEWHRVTWRSDDLVHPSLLSVEAFEP